MGISKRTKKSISSLVKRTLVRSFENLVYLFPPMTVRLSLPVQASLAVFAFAVLALSFISSASALTTVDTECLKKAVNERSKLIKTAYDTYAKDMAKASERLQTSETDITGFGDITFRQSEIQRIYDNFTYEVSERSRDLSGRLTEAWNSFEKSRSLCNASALPASITPAYTPPNYGAPTYGNYSYGNYPYSGYSYGSYSPYYSPYTPYRSYDAYSRYDSYDYDAYTRYRYGDALYTRYHGAATCSQRSLAPPPPGCGYQYGTDSSGCPSYTPVCNNTQSSSSPCTCSNLYTPVCGRDGRTYFNACYALCLGGTVQYQGPCQY